MKLFKSKIEKLLIEQNKLKVKRQKVIDRKNEANSRIETKLKVLENEAFRIDKVAKGKIAEIDRQYQKNAELMRLEAKYNMKVVTDAQVAGVNKGADDE